MDPLLTELPSHLKREVYKEDRRKKMTPLLTMEKPMYDNIKMKDPEDNLLCTISLKKARWYVKKNLAEWLDDSSIQLLFKPKMQKKDPQQVKYNQADKRNHCVVCGNTRDYMRHYVVPYCYRCQFPEQFKAHLPHDVVLLCPDCHVRAERASHKRMQLLEDELRDDPNTAFPHFVDRRLHSLRSSAHALLKWKNRLPFAKIQEYEAVLREWSGLPPDQELSTVHLEQASQLEERLPNPEYIPGPHLVIESLKDDSAIEAFVHDWRAHFVDSLQPRYLPAGWSVKSPVMCDVRV